MYKMNIYIFSQLCLIQGADPWARNADALCAVDLAAKTFSRSSLAIILSHRSMQLQIHYADLINTLRLVPKARPGNSAAHGVRLALLSALAPLQAAHSLVEIAIGLSFLDLYVSFFLYFFSFSFSQMSNFFSQHFYKTYSCFDKNCCVAKSFIG